MVRNYTLASGHIFVAAHVHSVTYG